MVETVHQNGTADGFHVLFCKLTLETPVRKNICPSAPPTNKWKIGSHSVPTDTAQCELNKQSDVEDMMTYKLIITLLSKAVLTSKLSTLSLSHVLY